MHCFICKKEFITTKTQQEFFEKQVSFFIEICKSIENDFALHEDTIWENILTHEALLLAPDKSPYSCIAKKCHSVICRVCYHNYKDNYKKCMVCKGEVESRPGASTVENKKKFFE